MPNLRKKKDKKSNKRRHAVDDEENKEPTNVTDSDGKEDDNSTRATGTLQPSLERTLTLLTEIVVKDREERQAEKIAQKELEEKRETETVQEKLKMKDQQVELEKMRMEHEERMIVMQQEFIQKQNKESDRKRIAERMSKLEDKDQPEAYLQRFEDIMNESEIPVEQWPQRLRPLLAGKALLAYSRNVPESLKKDYFALKEELLNALGHTVKQCRTEFWNLCRKYGDTWQDTARKIDSMVDRMSYGCSTIREVTDMFSMYKFYSLCPTDAVDYAQLHHPKSTLEAANLIYEYQKSHSRDRRFKCWNKSGNDQECSETKKQHESFDANGGEKHKTRFTRKYDEKCEVKKNGHDQHWVPTCFGCGKQGHKVFECPEKKRESQGNVKRIVTPSLIPPKYIHGKIGEHECRMLLDSGADKSVVHPSIVSPNEWLGKTMKVKGVHGNTVECPLARVWLHTGEYSTPLTVVAIENSEDKVIIGRDIGPIFDHLMMQEICKHDDEKKIETSELSLISEKQTTICEQLQGTVKENSCNKVHEQKENKYLIAENSDCEMTEEKQCIDMSNDECEETNVEDDRIVLVTRSEEEKSKNERDEVERVVKMEGAIPKNPDELLFNMTPSDTELGEKPENNSEMLIVPLPSLCEGKTDSEELRQEVLQDKSLEELRQWGDKNQNNYFWRDGLLKHAIDDGVGETWERMVVPEGRRQYILKMAHNIPMAGHLSVKKTSALLKRYYTWPGISRDIKNWCLTCSTCQKVNKSLPKKSPLKPFPVISTPFETMAFDLVGPFQKSQNGYRYVLTSICLASKYPDAVVLKDVKAESVAEGMIEIFSRTGIPKKLLTDQGQQFVGHLNKQLCQKLKIEKLQTSAYHPECNGCLERFHGTLTPMIKKSMEKKKDWAKQIKLALFAYRCSPHSSTGYSPFEIIYGRNMRGPLEVIKDSWEGTEKQDFNMCEWMEKLQERLEVVRECVRKNEVEAKEKMKKEYDKRAKERDLKEGSLVLLRVPGLQNKLDDAWDGPFEVSKKLNDVNYEVVVPNKRTKRKIVHVNNCKEWKQSESSILRIVVAAEEEGDEKETLKLIEGNLTMEQQKQLQQVLTKYSSVMKNDPGLMSGVVHDINTGDSVPCRTLPYRICPAWRDSLKEEIQKLQEAGIIEASNSPWSSPIVPVKKPDGSVRICIDFRKLNGVTVSDPYCMPLIDDLLDQVGESTYLSKLDLTKGFYQIPVNPEHRDKTAFCSPWGKFKFTRMPFGLKNAPASFQRAMHGILAGQEEYSSSYIDDIIIFSKSWADHLSHIEAVLDTLMKHGITAKPSKCQWGARKLVYLGHVVGEGKISVPEARVESIRKFLKPVTKKDMRCFWGTTSYYRKFISKYADYAYSLTKTTRKTAPNKIVWTQEMIEDFNHLCNALCSTCSLTIPTKDDSFLVQTDASGKGIAGVLSVIRSKEELPVAFYSRQLQPRETKYAATELECLAVRDAVKHYEVYLNGRSFVVQTDHRALESLLKSTDLNPKLTRWALYLQQFSMTITYRPGSKNQNADGLSRQAWNDVQEMEHHLKMGEMSGNAP